MTLFRARRWGSADWTLISVGGDVSEDEAPLAQLVGGAMLSAGNGETFHVQQLSDDGVWENLGG